VTKLLVLDAQESVRCATIAQAFREAGGEVYQQLYPGDWVVVPPEIEAGRALHFDAVVVHEADVKIFAGQIPQGCPVFFYTGGTNFRAQINWFRRPVGTNSIAPHEATEFLNWIAAGCNRNELPSLLCDADPRRDLLSALAILCQVFLVSLADASSEKMDARTAALLASMGWHSDVISTDIKHLEFHNVAQWLGALNMPADALLPELSLVKPHLADVEALAQEIVDAATTGRELSISLVANAYAELAQQLSPERR
jgi:hypothetical protein